MYQSEKERKFWEFHENNPTVFFLFRQYAMQIKKTGRERYSARTIFHRIRWHNDINTSAEDGFKINDHHSPYYALLLESEQPEFKGFFHHRGKVKLTFAIELPLDPEFLIDRTPIEDREPLDTPKSSPWYQG